MGHITTVLGEIPTEELGYCQCHEHLSIARNFFAGINPDICIDDREKSTSELLLYRAAGGRAIVDAQPAGCGRDAAMLEEISRRSGVHVIASTGFHRMMYYPEDHWIHQYDCDRLTRLYISELTEGMYALCDVGEPGERIGCRAGQVKAALDAGRVTDEYRKLLTAAADAAKETDRALMVHIEACSDPIGFADFLYKTGIKPDRVIFCHMDRSVPDLAVHAEICARGVTLEYDTVARPKHHDDMREAGIIVKMLQNGYEDQLLVSLDTTRSRLKSYGGSIGLDYIITSFIPLLKQTGVSAEIIKKLFVSNPARIYSH